MAYAYDEDELPPLPKREEVERDLADWRARLTDLFGGIESWIGNDPRYRVVRSEVNRLEPMMTAVQLPVMEFPALGIGWSDTEARGTTGILFRPEARWVVGTRGRVWISTPSDLLYLIDKGTDDRADWWIYPKRSPYQSVPFTRDEVLRLLAELP